MNNSSAYQNQLAKDTATVPDIFFYFNLHLKMAS